MNLFENNVYILLFSVISANIVLISRAFRHQFIIPDFQGFSKHIEDFYWKCKSNTEGKVSIFLTNNMFYGRGSF